MSKEYTITLNLEELEVVGHGMGHVAYARAKPVIEKIEAQINAQMEVDKPEEVQE